MWKKKYFNTLLDTNILRITCYQAEQLIHFNSWEGDILNKKSDFSTSFMELGSSLPS